MRPWLALALAACDPDSRLPTSTSTAEIPPPEAVIVATPTSVSVDGVAVATVAGAAIADAKPVEAALAAKAQAARAATAKDPSAPAFRGAVSLELDRELPAGVLLQLVDAAAAAGFGKPWIVVEGPSGRTGVKLALPTAAQAAAAGAAAAPAEVGGYANPTIHLDPDRGYRIEAHDDVIAGADAWLGCTPSPCGLTGWPSVELVRVARRLKLDHPRDRGVIVSPAGAVPVQAVVTALDATRDDRIAGRGVEAFPDALLGRP